MRKKYKGSRGQTDSKISCINKQSILSFLSFTVDNNSQNWKVFSKHFNETWWSTNYQSDLPQSLKYDMFCYKLYLVKLKRIQFRFNIWIFFCIFIQSSLSKGNQYMYNKKKGYDNRALLKKNTILSKR